MSEPARATPQDLRDLYEEQTGLAWSEDEGVTWLSKNRERLIDLIYTRISALDASAHITLSDKVGWLSQRPCRVCGSGFPVSFTPFRIPPESWQALTSVDKRAFKAAMVDHLSHSPHIERQEGRVCLTFLFVCSARRRMKDVDNMAKLLMDSIKGRMIADDREVDHLNIMRLVHEGDEEYVYVQIASSGLNDHSDVVDPRIRHSWAGAEALNLEDFRA